MVWRSREKTSTAQQRRTILSEGEAIWIALRNHPQWGRQWEDGTLPEEIVADDGQPMNPHTHIVIHSIVERQLVADNPAGVATIAQQLGQLGLSRHDVRHEISRAMANQMWYMSKEGCPFDRERYLADLREIVESYKTGGPR